MMDLKELEKFLKICRKQGVSEITWNDVSVRLGEAPVRRNSAIEEVEEETDELTGDDLIYYATQGRPQ